MVEERERGVWNLPEPVAVDASALLPIQRLARQALGRAAIA